jgi:tRNA(fMet)-specific endonuclease VapC
MYILDADLVIAILRDPDSPEARRLQNVDPDDIALCSVVKARLYHMARAQTSSPRRLQAVTVFCEPYVSYTFDDVCAERYGQIGAYLDPTLNRTTPEMMMIAATAIRHNLTLATNRPDDFAEVMGLRLEDWRG